MAQTTRMFRIFVSSTFSDLKAERNALQQRVWPRLRALCQRHGARFQAIDLRWGVSQEASLDQQTLTICLDEIARSQQASPRPNFLVLLGDRYGSRLLPAQLPATEFEAIRERVSPDEAERLKPWYARDDNAVPAEYVLQPRTKPYDDAPTWAREERDLRAILVRGVEQLPAGSYDPAQYFASATEREILAGALGVADAAQHVHAFLRSITNLDDLIADVPRTDALPDTEHPDEQHHARAFVDLEAPEKRDAEARDRLENLKGRLATHLGDANIHTYDAQWAANGLTSAHLDQLCTDVEATLTRLIEAELARQDAPGAVASEEASHATFGVERRHGFQGRGDILQTIVDYLAGTARQPLVIYGASGVGKSALVAQASAQASAQAQAERQNAAVVVRFIGATPESSDTRALLQSLCRQIAHEYSSDESTIPTDLEGLTQELPKRLALASAQRPLVVFLDALDQLGDGQRAPNLSWLPSELPEHVRLVVSILAGDALEQLRRRLPAGGVVQLKPLGRSDAERVLTQWLVEAQPPRTLRQHQRDEVLNQFAVEGLPLYLRLAFEEARRWKSFTPVDATALVSTIPGIIGQLFTRLSAPANHGGVLVAHGLGYLGAAKAGLSEDEMLDVLSRDAQVLDDFRARSPNSPQFDRLPVVIWSRLAFDLLPYLTERSTEGAMVLAFYHRQLGEAVVRLYLNGDAGIARHRALATYFAGPAQGAADAAATPPDGAAPDLRRLAELPYQQTLGEQWDEVFATLTDFRFLEQKASHLGVLERTDAQGNITRTYTGVYQLQDDYDLALEKMPAE
ncbi:MAG TPA: AAA family ATPase [Ktedonobacterales bacterium]|nr:AAA family ATPase [Ktedonobacterales bacterium]